MRNKKHQKLLTKYGSEKALAQVIAEKKQFRKPLWIALLSVLLLGLTLSILSYFKVF